MGDGSTLTTSRFDSKGKGRAASRNNGDILALDLGAAEEGAAPQHGDAFMQMQLVEQQVCPLCLQPDYLLNQAIASTG